MNAPDPSARFAVLAEALPWLMRYRGSVIVVKYGGNAMTDRMAQEKFAADIVFLQLVGLQPVVVHGGGPQIGDMLARLGIESSFAGGYRVTTPEVMGVVRMVLTGQVQRELVSLMNLQGPYAVGVSGEDGHLFTGRRLRVDVAGASVDLGLVGEITGVRSDFVHDLLKSGYIPVVSSIAVGEGGDVLNVNADSAASALAVALGARKLVILTDVAGLYRDGSDPSTLIRAMSASELEELVPSLHSGMVPKMRACLDAVAGGVERAHVIDGRTDHAVLIELLSDSGVGTMVVS